mmetsp:Transcript_91868/g.262767  ORF Transcript_91868/g.262767 Transcript_91868/m.262767 type:complete len:108 (+) Transcript_91868:1038-1361(+)
MAAGHAAGGMAGRRIASPVAAAVAVVVAVGCDLLCSGIGDDDNGDSAAAAAFPSVLQCPPLRHTMGRPDPRRSDPGHLGGLVLGAKRVRPPLGGRLILRRHCRQTDP